MGVVLDVRYLNGVPAHTDLYDQAEQVLREAIATMPDQSQFYYSLGVVLGKVQRYKVHQPHWFSTSTVHLLNYRGRSI